MSAIWQLNIGVVDKFHNIIYLFTCTYCRNALCICQLLFSIKGLKYVEFLNHICKYYRGSLSVGNGRFWNVWMLTFGYHENIVLAVESSYSLCNILIAWKSKGPHANWSLGWPLFLWCLMAVIWLRRLWKNSIMSVCVQMDDVDCAYRYILPNILLFVVDRRNRLCSYAQPTTWNLPVHCII